MQSDNGLSNEVSDLLLSTVRQGDTKTLKSHLSTIEHPEIYLNRIYDEPHKQKCTLLMIACLNKYKDMVRLLLDYTNLDMEMLNNIQLLEKDQNLWMFEDVTILWAAAATNNLEIVKLLVEHGARINHTTKTNSTALRCACCNGNINMARYLIENGADVHINKVHNETNLIASVFNEDLKMTIYILDELGVDINECIDDKRSPLYIATDRGSLELVELLLIRGARNFRTIHDDQISPLLLAAEKRRTDVVDAISAQCSLLEQIEAAELLGSAFACDEHGPCDLEKSLEHFHRALELRSKHNFPKALRLVTVEALDNRQECQTINQLEELRLTPESIYVEALLVRERLLGPTSVKYRHSLRYRGAVLADYAQHHLGILFWLYELELRRQHSIAADMDDLRQWASIFSDTIRTSPVIPMMAWQTVLTVIVEELEHNKTDFDFNLLTLLFLITVVSQILPKGVISHADHKVFYRHIYIAVQRQYVTRNFGSSLLHLSLNGNTTADEYFIDYSCIYPCLNTARILLQCGADVNAIDSVRNTPLHVLVSNSDITDNAIVELLCDADAHLDCVNALGELPVDLTSNLNIKQFLKSRAKFSLKCLCAKLIQKSGIPFHGKIVASLVKFVEKH